MSDPDQLKADADAAFRSGDLVGARDLYGRALEAKPNWAAAHNNMAMVLRQLGDRTLAATHFRSALDADPNLVGALSNLGALLVEVNEIVEASEVLTRALELAPDNPGVLYNWASVATAAQNYEAAREALEQSTRLNPSFAQAHANLGLCYRSLGDPAAARACYQRAIEADPSLAESYINLAAVCADLEDIEGAIAAGEKAINLGPDFPEAHYNLGNALNRLPDFKQALVHYDKALALKPDHSEAATNRARSLWSLGRIDDAYASIRKILERDPNYPAVHSNLIFKAHYDASQSPEMIYAEARRWNTQFGHHPDLIQRDSLDLNPERTLRVGYLSPHLTVHPVGYFLHPALAHHNAAQIEAVCYADASKEDAQTAKLKATGVSWVNVQRESHDALAHRLRADGIDILIDLDGHSGPNRLPVFARRAAPIQATWAGYVGTTGLDAMDYLITDHRQTVGADLGLMTEQPVYMPGNYVTVSPLNEAPDVGPCPSDANSVVTFGCFNNLAKVNEPVIALWAKVLNAVPNSRLKLVTFDLGDAAVRARIQAMFAAHGVQADRLDLVGRLPRKDLLAAYNDIDIALDTFPYSGGLTTLEALWMGVPVITKADGDRFAARHSVTHLTAVGLADCIADDAEDYAARAVALAQNGDRRRDLRANLRDQMRASPACDGAAFTGALERAYRIMWHRFCAGEAKSPIQEEDLRVT